MLTPAETLVCLELFPYAWQGGARRKLSEPRLWICWVPGGCFCGSPMRGKHQCVSQDRVWIGCTLLPVSDNPCICLRCRLLSKLKWRIGEKKEKTPQINRISRQSKTEKKTKKVCWVERTRFQRLWQGGFQRVGRAIRHRAR